MRCWCRHRPKSGDLMAIPTFSLDKAAQAMFCKITEYLCTWLCKDQEPTRLVLALIVSASTGIILITTKLNQVLQAPHALQDQVTPRATPLLKILRTSSICTVDSKYLSSSIASKGRQRKWLKMVTWGSLRGLVARLINLLIAQEAILIWAIKFHLCATLYS